MSGGFWDRPDAQAALKARSVDRAALSAEPRDYCGNCHQHVAVNDLRVLDMGRGRKWNVCGVCIDKWSAER